MLLSLNNKGNEDYLAVLLSPYTIRHRYGRLEITTLCYIHRETTAIILIGSLEIHKCHVECYEPNLKTSQPWHIRRDVGDCYSEDCDYLIIRPETTSPVTVAGDIFVLVCL